MNLALDHPERTAESLGSRLRFVGRERGPPVRDRRGEGAQHRFGLIFVNVHGNELAGERRAGGERGEKRPRRRGFHASAGLIALHASIKPRTEATDLANIALSASSSVISTIRSTPFAPITTGTPI